MSRYFSLAHVSAGFVAVLVGYTSAAAIVFQAAAAGGAGPDEISSWLWALGLGMGLSGISLSLWYRHPVMIAWSTPGAALLVTSLPGIAMSDAIGAFLFCSGLITLCGVTGWFDKIMAHIPKSLAAAMLAGVLLDFGLNVFVAMQTDLLLVGAMLGVYILGKWRGSGYAIPLTLLMGIVIAAAEGRIDLQNLTLHLTEPVFTAPGFDLSVWVGVGLPLFIVTMASQNVPGLATLRAHGYQTPASPLIGWTGAFGLLLAPFGGYAFNLAAITAAICMGKDVDADPNRRYMAAVWAGIFYIIAGLFGATVAGFFAAFPTTLVAAIAGLALLGTIAGSLKSALQSEAEQGAAMLTFAVTAAGGGFFGIGAPFWGLVIGLIVYHLMMRRARAEAKGTAS